MRRIVQAAGLLLTLFIAAPLAAAQEQPFAAGEIIQEIRIEGTQRVDPATVLTQTEPLADAIEAYKAFDLRESGWVKVELRPQAEERQAA